jgi:hypothetical protein
MAKMAKNAHFLAKSEKGEKGEINTNENGTF